MRKTIGLFALILGFSVAPIALHAQVDDGTMDVIEEEGELLSLPDSASDAGVENSAAGLETANEARAKGRDFGQERAEAARENRGADGRAKAAEARENAGRP